MPQKPTKWGIKAFTLADAANGYLLNTLVYTGAQTLENADPTFDSLPQPARTCAHTARNRNLQNVILMYARTYYVVFYTYAQLPGVN